MISPESMITRTFGVQHRSHILVGASIVALVTWFVKVAFVLVLPLRMLAISPWLIDDSFIIMRIARNLALGHGFSFDGVHPTSGTSLLWTLLTSINHLFLGPEMAAKMTIIESSFFGAVSSVLLFMLAYRLFGGTVAWGSLLFVTFSPPFLLNSMNGMETSLFTCLGLLAVLLYYDAKTNPSTSLTRYFIIGGVLGLLNLVRFDGLFLVMAIGIVELWLLVQHKTMVRANLVRMVVLMVGVVLCTLPLIGWSFYTSGILTPANQVGRRFIAWEGVISGGTIDWGRYLVRSWIHIFVMTRLFSIITGLLPFAFVAFLNRSIGERCGVFCNIVVLYILLYPATLVFYQGYFPDMHGLRYLNLSGYLITIPMMALCYDFVRRIMAQRSSAAQQVARVSLVLLLVGASAYQYEALRESLPWAKDMRTIPIYDQRTVDAWWQHVDWLNANLPPGTGLAAQHHGVIAYFTDVRVVDLTGIIKPDVLTHLEQGNIKGFLEQEQAAYVILNVQHPTTVEKAIISDVEIEPVFNNVYRIAY